MKPTDNKPLNHDKNAVVKYWNFKGNKIILN